MTDHFKRGDLSKLGKGKRRSNTNINPPNQNTNKVLFGKIRASVKPLIEKAKGKEEWLLEWRMYPTTSHHGRDVSEKGHGCGCGCGCGE